MTAAMLPWITSNFHELTDVQWLGGGGQKTCYRALHPSDGLVVLKLISPSESVDVVEREILAAQQVHSPRVPPIFAWGTIPSPWGDQRWVRERFIEGETVRAALKSGPQGFNDVVKLVSQNLEALVSAEQVQIVHRDVKPDNIMKDLSGNYWLIDFGIARHLSLASLTATATPWGKQTLGYAPQEQMRNSKPEIDTRSDLFALGVTALECFTAVHPFRSGAVSSFDIVRSVETLSVANPFLGSLAEQQFGDLIVTMVQKRRDLRPRTAQEALTWIQDIINTNGIVIA